MSGLFDKAKDLISGNKDKVDDGIDKAGDMVDDHTGGKHADKVDMGQDKANEMLGKLGDDDTPKPMPPTTAPPA